MFKLWLVRSPLEYTCLFCSLMTLSAQEDIFLRLEQNRTIKTQPNGPFWVQSSCNANPQKKSQNHTFYPSLRMSLKDSKKEKSPTSKSESPPASPSKEVPALRLPSTQKKNTST